MFLIIGTLIVSTLSGFIENALVDLTGITYLTQTMAEFNPSLFSVATTILEQVSLPMAYVILCIFFVLEIYKISMRVEGAGGNMSFGAEPVFKAFIKMILCKMAVDMSAQIVLFIQMISTDFIIDIKNLFQNDNSYEASVNSIIDNLLTGYSLLSLIDIGSNLVQIIEAFIAWVGSVLATGAIKIMSVARFIELYLYYVVSPIAIATFPSDEFSQIGKNFLKNVAALSFQGVLIYILVRFYVTMFDTLAASVSSFLDLIIYMICIALAAMSSGRVAKSMFSAH